MIESMISAKHINIEKKCLLEEILNNLEIIKEPNVKSVFEKIKELCSTIYHQLIDEYQSLIKSTSDKKEIINWLESRFVPLCNEILSLLKEALALSKKL